MINQIINQLSLVKRNESYYPKIQAAVLMPIIEQAKPQLLLLERALNLSSHPGEIAFPGGKYDQSDRSLEVTALRESYEEIGMQKAWVQIIGELPHVKSKSGLLVLPYVGLVLPGKKWVINEMEVASVFQVPLQFFLDIKPSQFTESIIFNQRVKIPCYHYHSYRIWGLTALIITTFVNLVFNANIPISVIPS